MGGLPRWGVRSAPRCVGCRGRRLRAPSSVGREHPCSRHAGHPPWEKVAGRWCWWVSEGVVAGAGRSALPRRKPFVVNLKPAR